MDKKSHFQTREFDVIVVSRHYVARRYLSLFREMCPEARIIFDTVDLHCLREQREAELKGDVILKARALGTKALEYDIMGRCDQTWVVSEREVEEIEQEQPEIDVKIVSNVIDVPGTEIPFDDRRDILFIGGYQHTPNIDAVIWFVEEVWPIVRDALPDVKFRIVGSAAPSEVKALGEVDHVEFLGFIESVEPIFEEVRISVAPLRYGAGVKGKINQSMSLGLPVVSTSIGAEGMGLEHEIDVLIGDDAEAFAAAVIRLYSDKHLWSKLQGAGLKTMRELFSLDAMKERLGEIFPAQ
jgi:glycosyltransferase involved in cell wall biosynthesis